MILCCGEALIDFLPGRTAAGATAYEPVCGGSVYNTAIALGRLGVPVGLFTGLSTDFFGDMLRDGLKASKVSLAFIKDWDKPSTLAFVKLSKGHARYSFFDDNSAGRMLTKRDLPKLAKSVQALHFGSISLIPEPGGGTLEALMRRESGARVICLDPNIRPGVIKHARTHMARLNRMIAMADIVKVSDEDVAWMTGKDDAAAARKWLKRGAGLVVVTRGARGVEAFTAQESMRMAAQKVKVADTVGAGDTFTAGLLTALRAMKLLDKARLPALKAGDLALALGFAAKAAAITCSRPGADPPWASEMV
ncbi:carbohydrate kinase [Aestuariivirga sp.]|uniref:carbohydrate kinase family protein n=1 Tax=Aestuariivirga sp. TaxID=2650926 RepID=UPI0025C66C76|nr:carbohydrate kinase [Aestuariivirga sp.]MCA3554731.1 carbohydrate kinase [Aestuariivirga sp.]